MAYYTKWTIERRDIGWKTVLTVTEKIGYRLVNLVRSKYSLCFEVKGVRDSPNRDVSDGDFIFMDGPWLLTRAAALTLASYHRPIDPDRPYEAETYCCQELVDDIQKMQEGDRLIIWGDP